ncbi:putative membrane protein [Mycolicibacterium chubuense NBB4]|uniref:Putative membrane protein n=1 Tax=Mycolicibacterium chubuense (strain NBB4) TaxID=710421 RepID=I4BPI3_MYCCN|nr:alpha/beta hydrolase [Mycolicibacterium chubuense]AFM19190.1 putative membrane protein [Mycolicibacterium chubuense NBB4]
MTTETEDKHPVYLWAWNLLRLDFIGIVFGALFFCMSLTPSLLPRDWLFQGLLGGINAAIGYGIGVFVAKMLRRFVPAERRWSPRASVAKLIKTAIVAVSAAVCVLMVIPAAAWQRQVSSLMGMQGPGTAGYLRTLLLAAAVAGVCVAVTRVLIDLIKTMARFLIRRWRLSDELALFIGTAIVVVLVITLVNGVLLQGFLAGANRIFQPQNTTTMAGVLQPLDPERSGSPESFAPWDTLGYQGRNFVGTGPSAAELSRINGRPAKVPVRVYVGLQTADTEEARMAVLLSELERTGAFDRKVLVIVPTTGTGWVNPIAARSLEMMYNGDTAIVASQYSYLPSWISFIGDQQKSLHAGRMLIDAVHDRWIQQPPQWRPRLMLYGESLGSMAGQGAFDWLPDISRMGFSSVLWVGPPNASRLWRGLTARRDPGTPEVEPRYDNGRTVRFSQAYDAAEIAHDTAPPWEGTRVLYLQHSSDPIVWWSQDLLFTRPDWLSEPPGRDRTASMRWYPIVTFWQVAADLTNAASVPRGHGHNYGDYILDGWAGVAAPAGWTSADTERIRIALRETESEDGNQ